MSPTHASSGTPRRAAVHRTLLTAWLCAAFTATAASAAAAAPVAGPAVAAQDNATPEVKPAAKPVQKRRAKAAPKSADKTARVAEEAPLPAPGAMPPPPAAGGELWEIALTDRTLNAALSRWAAAAGWQLLWELPVDYSVQARTSIPGKFEDAVAMVVTSMEGAEIPMKAVFYQGNKVLRIMAKGAQ